MVNNPHDDRPSALRILENGPFAPQCPDGHGPLTTITDDTAPTGAALACPVCGQRGTQVNMLRTLLNPENARFDQPLAAPAENPALAVTTEIPRIVPEDSVLPEDRARPEDTAREPLGKLTPETTRDDLAYYGDEPDDIPGHAPHRGRKPDGTIRTTGWLQLGTRPISSGLWAALAGAALGLALTDLHAWLPLILPAAAYATWFAATHWMRPASAATNVERVYADELLPGDAIRLYGQIGPVGIIDQVTEAGNQQILIRCTGGTQHFRPANARCHVVELRN